MPRQKSRSSGPLEPRSLAILRAVIEEYVATALPVGSQTLVARYDLGVSSATVRNVMADLEEDGYLTHPHTSAGRVPTDAGYRVYVEGIARDARLAPIDELMIRHQFGQVEYASEQWFRLAASTLAAATHAAGLATPAKPRACRVRRIDLIPNGQRTASLVLVLAEGAVKQVLLGMDEPLDAGELDAVAREVNRWLGGCSTRQVEHRLDEMRVRDDVPALAVRAADRVVRLMREFDAAVVEDVFSEGLLNVMEAPEFAESAKVRRVFGMLQDLTYLGGLVRDVSRGGDVRVFIGTENTAPDLRDVSLVLAPYGRPGRATGVVGVLGPTRMSYAHAIGTVRYVSGLMNELVDHLYT